MGIDGLASVGESYGSRSTPFWPQPEEYELGTGSLKVCKKFTFKQTGDKMSVLLQRGFERYQAMYTKDATTAVADHDESTEITECSVSIANVSNDEKQEKESLDVGVDESYTLKVTNAGVCEITAPTVWGGLRALETFTQMLTRDNNGGDEGQPMLNYAPVSVTDNARFSHRGVLIDSARHFLPVSTVKQVIDSLAMSKYNVLHWHLVDAQSFPLDTPSSPKMKEGAFTPSDMYTLEQLTEVTRYATDRGVRILFEVDGPGHTASWGEGYPEILATCRAKYGHNVNNLALNPILDKTYDVVQGILADIIEATGAKYMHLGGDEVVYGCWALDDTINAYMQKNGITEYSDLLSFYADKAEAITTKLGATPVQWEDTFMAGYRPKTDTIFDVWTNSTNVKLVTDAGYRVIAAPQEYWYLDHADNTWQKMYSYDPTFGMTEEQRELIVGGEASMWGEMVDQFNIMPKIWPTAAAVAERLWSPMNATEPADSDNMVDAAARLNALICRMNGRGFRVGPISPGFCAENWV